MTQGFTKGLTIPVPASQGGTGTVGTGILDTNGNEVITYPATASAVNYVEFINSATGVNPQVLARGDDTNIVLQLGGKGTGGAAIVGTSTNNNAGTAYVGEEIKSEILNASAVTATTATIFNLTSISLTAGDWDVWGHIGFQATAAVMSEGLGWISTTSATLPDYAYVSLMTIGGGSLFFNHDATVSPRRISLASTTTVYISGRTAFGSGTVSGRGFIIARRRR